MPRSCASSDDPRSLPRRSLVPARPSRVKHGTDPRREGLIGQVLDDKIAYYSAD
jgi:hypothetical protein